MEPNQNLPVDEVVDFVADSYEFGEFVYETFKDGVQPVNDGLALFGKREQIEEFVRDWPTFKAQIGDIKDDEPSEIVDGVVSRLGMGVNKARRVVRDALVFAAALYESYQAGQNLVATVKS